MGAYFRRGGDYEPWDFEVSGGSFGGARVLMAIEDQGSGTQYVRSRVRPFWRVVGVAPVAFLAAISVVAWDEGFAVAAAVLGLGGLLVLCRILSEAASAQTVILEGLTASQPGPEANDIDHSDVAGGAATPIR